MKLTDLLEYQASLFVFDFEASTLPVSFNDTLTFNRDMPNARDKRQSHHLHVAKTYNVFAGRLPIFSIPRIWNKWVNKIPQDGTRWQFKRKLKAHIYDNYPDVVKCNIPCNECCH